MHSELQTVGMLESQIIGVELATTMAELEANHQMRDCHVGQGYSSFPLMRCSFTAARSPSSLEKHPEFLFTKSLYVQPSSSANNSVFIGLLIHASPWYRRTLTSADTIWKQNLLDDPTQNYCRDGATNP